MRIAAEDSTSPGGFHLGQLGKFRGSEVPAKGGFDFMPPGDFSRVSSPYRTSPAKEDESGGQGLGPCTNTSTHPPAGDCGVVPISKIELKRVSNVPREVEHVAYAHAAKGKVGTNNHLEGRSLQCVCLLAPFDGA